MFLYHYFEKSHGPFLNLSDLNNDEAKQTAEPLARYMGIEIEYLEKLREHNIGEAVGKSKQWAK